MGKIKLIGLAPPDDPMFTGGVEFFRKIDDKPEHEEQTSIDENLPPFEEFCEIEVKWGRDVFSLSLSEIDWKKIKKGDRLLAEVLDERFDMWISWHFNCEADHNLILDYGDPNQLRWLGSINEAKIRFSADAK